MNRSWQQFGIVLCGFFSAARWDPISGLPPLRTSTAISGVPWPRKPPWLRSPLKVRSAASSSKRWASAWARNDSTARRLPPKTSGMNPTETWAV